MPTVLAQILKQIDQEQVLEQKVAYVFLYPNYRNEIMAHIMKDDVYALPA